MPQPLTEAAGMIVAGGPERLFRIDSVAPGRTSVTGSMTTGPWSAGPDGRPCAGSLGVLVDNVLGYAIQTRRPEHSWSVSTEISIDFLADFPTDGSPLYAEGRVLQLDAIGGMASGQVIDSTGRVIAHSRQRGRFVTQSPGVSAATSKHRLLAADTATVIGIPACAMPDLPLEVTAELGNPLGNLHGGVSLCASELAGIAALRSSNQALVTASIHVAYVRPVPVGTHLVFSPSVLHRGRTFALAQVVSTNETGKPCTIATITAHNPS
ncbi:PaaI family thioesterase [Kribbella alba]